MLHTSPETLRSVMGLRVVRRYLATPVSEEHLGAIIEAGRWTGSAKNRQPWTLVVIRDRPQIERLTECGDFTAALATAPLVIAPVKHPDGYDWDMGRIAQNIMLAAAAVGVGSCPVTLHREDCGRTVLGIPDDHRCQVVVALGHPDEQHERDSRARSPMAGRKRPEELVRYERYK